MKQLFKKPFIRLFTLVAFCCMALAGTAKAGLDYYEIYLGKKLIMKRYLNEPLNLQSLPLSEASANERLVIHYYQCNAPQKNGANRSIVVKDDKGNNIKEWKFADVKGSSAGMEISVKELLQLQKANKNKGLNLYYTANGREQGEKLVLLKPASKKTAFFSRDKLIDKV